MPSQANNGHDGFWKLILVPSLFLFLSHRLATIHSRFSDFPPNRLLLGRFVIVDPPRTLIRRPEMELCRGDHVTWTRNFTGIPCHHSIVLGVDTVSMATVRLVSFRRCPRLWAVGHEQDGGSDVTNDDGAGREPMSGGRVSLDQAEAETTVV